MDDGGNWVQCSAEPFNQIIPNLYQGGMVYGPAAKEWAPQDEFDVVINMAGRGSPKCRVTSEDVKVYTYYIDDGRLGPDEMAFVVEAVKTATWTVHKGWRTLVRCHMGWNRSGLVVALVLRNLGLEAQEAINLIRAKRDVNALCNEYFVKYIHEYPPQGE